MKDTGQKIIIALVLATIGIVWWQFGGVVLAVILGTLVLSGLLGLAFFLGGRWAFKAIETGSQIAIRSSAINDQHDALKTKALAELVGQAFKQVRVNQAPASTAGYPALPVFGQDNPRLTGGIVDANFTIAGLDEREEQPDSAIKNVKIQTETFQHEEHKNERYC